MGNFEDELMAVHRNITLSCLQYVQGKADKIFMYCILEDGLTTFNSFFKIGTNYCLASKVNNYLSSDQAIDISSNAQRKMLMEAIEDLEALREICSHYERETPREIWLVYDVKADKLQWDYSYDDRFAKDKKLSYVDELEKWLEEAKAKNL